MMNLTENQRETLYEVWSVIRFKLVEFIGKTRSKDVTISDGLISIRQDTLRLYKNYSEEDVAIIMQLIDFVIDSVITTKSLAQTIEKVDEVYMFSYFYKSNLLELRNI